MGHGYTEEELKEIHDELFGLIRLWNAYAQQQQDGANVKPHMPPAMLAFHTSMTSDNPHIEPLAQLREAHPELYAELSNVLVQYGDAMFNFGQYCVMQGLLHANMLPCNCDSKVVETFLTELFPDT